MSDEEDDFGYESVWSPRKKINVDAPTEYNTSHFPKELRARGFRLHSYLYDKYEEVNRLYCKTCFETDRIVWVGLLQESKQHQAWYSIGRQVKPLPERAPGTSPVGFTTIPEMDRVVQYLMTCMIHAPSAQELEDRELQRLSWKIIYGVDVTKQELRQLARYCFFDLEERGRGLPYLRTEFKDGIAIYKRKV